MRITNTFAATCVAAALSTGQALAQTKYDVGLLLGATTASDEGSVLQFDRATTYQATFAWRVWEGKRTTVSIEVPFIASPSFTVVTPGGALPKEYASLYLTPGVRLTVLPQGPVSVFGSIGGGYARYTEAKVHADGSPNPNQRDTDTGALQMGGGVDIRGFKRLGFRGEVRDIYTGARDFSIATPHEKVHNVVVSGGLVLHF